MIARDSTVEYCAGMKPDPEKVRVWETRAPAYDRLICRYEIFSLLSHRLIDLLPADLHGTVLDIGAGSGLTSEILLERHPRCDAILIDPSRAMRKYTTARVVYGAADAAVTCHLPSSASRPGLV